MIPGQQKDYQSDQTLPDLVLKQACSHCIEQCIEVVQVLPRQSYACASRPSSAIGTHVRHIIERFGCLLDGMVSGLVDYDARARSAALELDAELALACLQDLCARLASLESDAGKTLQVSETVDENLPPVVLSSTLERELLSLVSHTIHHLAIIALLARSTGVVLPEEVGKAPSTLRFDRSLEERHN